MPSCDPGGRPARERPGAREPAAQFRSLEQPWKYLGKRRVGALGMSDFGVSFRLAVQTASGEWGRGWSRWSRLLPPWTESRGEGVNAARLPADPCPSGRQRPRQFPGCANRGAPPMTTPLTLSPCPPLLYLAFLYLSSTFPDSRLSVSPLESAKLHYWPAVRN